MKPADWAKATLTFLGSLALGIVIGLVIVALVNAANSDRIEACERLNGEIVMRGFNCELPDGLIVDPIKWEENR